MNKPAIIHAISKNIYSLPPACQDELAIKSRLISVIKRQELVREGQTSNKMYFVVQGALRAYYLKDGNDITDWFAFENEFICPIRSFFDDVPSPHYIEALDDGLVLEMTKQDIAYLSDKYRNFERLGNLITTQTMLKLQKRIVSLQFENARQKYLNLLQEKPDIELRVPLLHIASYLGITNETLSRIRRYKERI